jgi:tetratricopeptide (TPR) repeat protein
MSKYRLTEAFLKVFLWIAVIIINIIYLAKLFEPLPDRLETLIISLNISAAVILLWFMPSSIAERKLTKGLNYLDKNNDKAYKYIEGYMNSKMLTDSERKNALRILGVAHHKRGDDKEAINCLNHALLGNDRDNDQKVEILGALGIIYSEAGEYQKAVEYFDKTFEIIFSISKANIADTTIVQVVNTYIKAGQEEKAVRIYDRLLMIQGFKRDKIVEELLDI